MSTYFLAPHIIMVVFLAGVLSSCFTAGFSSGFFSSTSSFFTSHSFFSLFSCVLASSFLVVVFSLFVFFAFFSCFGDFSFLPDLGESLSFLDGGDFPVLGLSSGFCLGEEAVSYCTQHKIKYSFRIWYFLMYHFNSKKDFTPIQFRMICLSTQNIYSNQSNKPFCQCFTNICDIIINNLPKIQ